jgi:hypothetical protein
MQTPPSPAHTRGSPADPAHSAQVVNARIGSKGQAGNPAGTRPRNSQMRPPLRSLPKSWDGVPKSKNTPHKATKAPTEYGAARPLSRLRASARHQRHNFQRLPWHRPGGACAPLPLPSQAPGVTMRHGGYENILKYFLPSPACRIWVKVRFGGVLLQHPAIIV